MIDIVGSVCAVRKFIPTWVWSREALWIFFYLSNESCPVTSFRYLCHGQMMENNVEKCENSPPATHTRQQEPRVTWALHRWMGGEGGPASGARQQSCGSFPWAWWRGGSRQPWWVCCVWRDVDRSFKSFLLMTYMKVFLHLLVVHFHLLYVTLPPFLFLRLPPPSVPLPMSSPRVTPNIHRSPPFFPNSTSPLKHILSI